MLTIETARVFEPLLKPSRYKGAWGGRALGYYHERKDERFVAAGAP